MEPIRRSKNQQDVGLFGWVGAVIGNALKSGTFKLSLVVVIIGGCWLFMQHRSISTVETETTSLEKQIATARSPSPTPPGAAKKGSRKTEDAEGRTIDWKNTLSQLSGQGDRRELTRLCKRLEGMTSREIGIAIEEIDGLELPTDSRDQLARILLPVLAAKDPEAALNRFLKAGDSRDPDMTVTSILTKALDNWARQDLGKANAWMDRKILSGAFDSKSLVGYAPMRIQLEGVLVRSLLPSNPAAAGRRLAELTEEGAFRVLSRDYAYAVKQDGDDAAFATLARGVLPESRRIEVFSNHASRLAKNYADVSGYLDRIDATPVEREACVEAVAGTKMNIIGYERAVTLDEVDALREWAGTNHSDIDKVTGNALGNAINGNRMTFDEASALVLHYYEASGNDAVIRSFLASDARSFGDSARALAEEIADPGQRAEILERIW